MGDDSSNSVDSIGDYGNPLQLGIGDPMGENADMRNREINNGRAAMFAALGIIVAELATGKNALEQLGFQVRLPLRGGLHFSVILPPPCLRQLLAHGGGQVMSFPSSSSPLGLCFWSFWHA